jgi:hypothetical protein
MTRWVAPFEGASSYHAGGIKEIVAVASWQGFDIRQAEQDGGDSLERASWRSSCDRSELAFSAAAGD